MLKQIFFTHIFLFTVVLFAQNKNEIIGMYTLPNGIELEIVETNNHFEGIIRNIHNYKETKDIYNPDKSKRNENLTGKVILKDLNYNEEENIWDNGVLYAPEKGMNVNLKITKSSQDEITVVVSKFIFHKTMKWKKQKLIKEKNHEK